MRQTSTFARLLTAALMAGAATASFAADQAPAPATAPAQQLAQAQPAGDAAITSQAQAALQKDKELQALPLIVSSTSAGVIILKGAAPTADLAQKAVQIVQAVPGVKEVRSEIKVG